MENLTSGLGRPRRFPRFLTHPTFISPNVLALHYQYSPVTNRGVLGNPMTHRQLVLLHVLLISGLSIAACEANEAEFGTVLLPAKVAL